MKKGDILRGKHNRKFAVASSNKLQSGYISVDIYLHGRTGTILSHTDRWEVIEFADGRINEALFPKNERAEEQRFEEEFYQQEIGQPVRPADRIDIPINADQLQEWARVVQRPQWVENPYIVDDRPEEHVQDEQAEVYGL